MLEFNKTYFFGIKCDVKVELHKYQYPKVT